MKNIKELKDFIRRNFPQGRVEHDGFEFVIHTGLSEDHQTKTLISVDQDDTGIIDDVEPEIFGRYR